MPMAMTTNVYGRRRAKATIRYLQSAIQLAQDPPQQVARLAGDGDAQAQAFLAREAYSRILFS